MAECSADELWKAELDLELTQLDAVGAQLELVVKKPRIQRIMTIPGRSRSADGRDPGGMYWIAARLDAKASS
jgi:hypothetical protein